MERLPGFKGEYLRELELPEKQLTALAEAIPADKYSWRPADRARSVSEVLVHIALGNFGLLDVVGVSPTRAMRSWRGQANSSARRPLRAGSICECWRT